MVASGGTDQGVRWRMDTRPHRPEFEENRPGGVRVEHVVAGRAPVPSGRVVPRHQTSTGHTAPGWSATGRLVRPPLRCKNRTGAMVAEMLLESVRWDPLVGGGATNGEPGQHRQP